MRTTKQNNKDFPLLFIVFKTNKRDFAGTESRDSEPFFSSSCQSTQKGDRQQQREAQT
jgi:hypothetical protein